MYVSIDYILNNSDRRTLIQLLNDESRSENEIDFEDPEDPIVVRLDGIIANVESEIDGYLAAKYTLPLTTVPNVIRDIAFDKVIYGAYKHRHPNDMPKSIVDINSANDKKLARIQTGTFSLNLPAVESSQSAGGIVVNKTDADRLFGKTLLDMF